MYKDKECQYNCCNEIFTPSTGNQKYCSICSEKVKQEKDRIRWKKQARRLNNYMEYQLRKEQGYDRIWDCGHRTYVYAIN